MRSNSLPDVGHRRTIIDIDKNRYDILMRMAAYFNTTCDYLLGYTPPQNSMPDLSDDAVAILQACGNLSPEGQDILKDEIKLILHHYQKQPK